MQYVIWSIEHNAWWRAGGHGYTPRIAEAGTFEESAAAGIVRRANFGGAEGTRPFVCHEAMIPLEAVMWSGSPTGGTE